MNWKKFLKPTVWKLILPVFYLLAVLLMYFFQESSSYDTYGIFDILSSSGAFLLIPLSFFSFGYWYSISSADWFFYLGLIVSMIAWYLISAILVELRKKIHPAFCAIILVGIFLLNFILVGFFFFTVRCGARSFCVLSMDTTKTHCSLDTLEIYVRNDGTAVCQNVDVNITYPNGTILSSICAIPEINQGDGKSVLCHVPNISANRGNYLVSGSGFKPSDSCGESMTSTFVETVHCS